MMQATNSQQRKDLRMIIRIKSFCFLIILCASLSFLILVACSSGPVTITANKPFIIVELSVEKNYYNKETGKTIIRNNIHFSAWVIRDPVPDKFELTINNKASDYYIAKNDFISSGLSQLGCFFDEPFIGSKYYEISTCGVTLSGTISIPDSIKIISPDDGDSISNDSTIVLTWKGKADWYTIGIAAYDSVNSFTGGLDTILFNTNFSLPENIISDTTNHLVIFINGTNGPNKTSGSTGNIQGDGAYGFVNAFNKTYGTDSITIYIKKTDKKAGNFNY